MDTKICCRCKQVLALQDFTKHSGHKDGLASICKACNNEKVKAWNAANPGKANERAKKYYQKHKQRYQARSRLWFSLNKARVNERLKTTYRDRHRFYQQRTQARAKGAKPPYMTWEEFQELLAFYGPACFYCGSSKADQLDHLIPLTLRGPHQAWNIVPACKKCNRRKYDLHVVDFLEADRRLELLDRLHHKDSVLAAIEVLLEARLRVVQNLRRTEDAPSVA